MTQQCKGYPQLGFWDWLMCFSWDLSCILPRHRSWCIRVAAKVNSLANVKVVHVVFWIGVTATKYHHIPQCSYRFNIAAQHLLHLESSHCCCCFWSQKLTLKLCGQRQLLWIRFWQFLSHGLHKTKKLWNVLWACSRVVLAVQKHSQSVCMCSSTQFISSQQHRLKPMGELIGT